LYDRDLARTNTATITVTTTEQQKEMTLLASLTEALHCAFLAALVTLLTLDDSTTAHYTIQQQQH
jgi:hypothetical protein